MNETKEIKPENYSLVDMTVSKKEIVTMMIEDHQLVLETSIDKINDQISELVDFKSVLTKELESKIVKEVKNHKVIKDYLSSHSSINAMFHQPKVNTVEDSVNLTFRHDLGVNVDVRVTTKNCNIYLGTSTKRVFDGTLNLNKISPTAKKLHKRLEKASEKVIDLRKSLDKKEKEVREFNKKSKKFKHQVIRAILNKSQEGKDMLAQIEKLSIKKLS